MFMYQPPVPERTIGIVRVPSAPRRTDSVMQQLASSWCPVNSELLHLVRENALGGLYRHDPSQFLVEIKYDPALLLYCVKSLKNFIDDPAALPDPLEKLGALEPEKIDRLLNVSEKSISPYRLKGMSKFQALRLQHSLISAMAAEMLARKAQVSPNIAFLAALTRQLGYSLMAWKYPELFTRAMTYHCRDGRDFDGELKRLVGVAPLDVSSHCAGEWNLNPILRRAISPALEKLELHHIKAVAQGNGDAVLTLSEICHLAEVIAKQNDREHFQVAESEWSDIESILRAFGASTVPSDARLKTAKLLLVHAELSPKVKSLPLMQECFPPAPALEVKRFEQNTYAQRCTPEVQKELELVYEKLKPTEEPGDALTPLIKRAVPAADFERGCVYVLDAAALLLVPTAVFGKKQWRPLTAVALDEDNLIAGAFATQTPLEEEQQDGQGEAVCVVCGSFGEPEKNGVLCLEVSAANAAMHDPLISFRAIRRALSDCLAELGQSGFMPTP